MWPSFIIYEDHISKYTQIYQINGNHIVLVIIQRKNEFAEALNGYWRNEYIKMPAKLVIIGESVSALPVIGEN